MLYFNLTNFDLHNDQSWIRIVKQLQHSLSKQPSLQNKILVCKIQDVTSDDSTMIPKLEHKNTNVV